MKKIKIFMLTIIIIAIQSPVNVKSEIFDTNVYSEKNFSNAPVVIDDSDFNYELDPVTKNAKSSIEAKSTYIDPKKVNADAGSKKIVFDVRENINLQIDENKKIISSNLISNNNSFAIENGEIVSADHAFFMTIGGTDSYVAMYKTLEDAYNGTDPVTLNATGGDGDYYETINYNDEKFVHIMISGFNGYMNLKDVQIIPFEMAMARTHYVSQNGTWYLNVAVDPINSSEYTTFPLSKSPEWAQENKRYYSSDDENFTEESNVSQFSGSSTYNKTDYFQNLQIRTPSYYNGSQYKDYLKAYGKTNSQYYDSTSSFVEAQNIKKINSLFLFAFANLEGGYGTSTYSYRCNNFYGRGAFDSNPDNACIEFGFDTPRDGIIAQAFFIHNNYLDVEEFLYYGGYVGNKNGGMNVKYATDERWGLKIASQMYQIDSYLGNSEINKYREVAFWNPLPVYKNSNLTNIVKTAKNNNYFLETGGINSSNPGGGAGGGGIRAVVLEENSIAMKILIDTPMNINVSGNYVTTAAKKGSYPTFNGNLNPVYVPQGTTSYAVDYNDLVSQGVWVQKTANGSQSFHVINDVPAYDPTKSDICPIPNPIANGITYSVSEDKTRKCLFEYSNYNLITEQNTLYVNGATNKTVRKEYNLIGKPTRDLEILYYTNEKIDYTTDSLYDSAGNVYHTGISKYKFDGTLESKTYKNYKKNILTSYETNIFNPSGSLSSITSNTYDKTSGMLLKSITAVYQINGHLYQQNINTYEDEKLILEEIYGYDAMGREINYTFSNFIRPGFYNQRNTTEYNVNHLKTTNTVSNFYMNSLLDNSLKKIFDNNGNVTTSFYNKNYFDGSKENYIVNKHFPSGIIYNSEKELFVNNIIVQKNVHEYNINGLPTRELSTNFNSNGTPNAITDSYFDNYSNISIQTKQVFNSNTTRHYNYKQVYSNGKKVRTNYDYFDTNALVYKTTVDNWDSRELLSTSENIAFNQNGTLYQKNEGFFNKVGVMTREYIIYCDGYGNILRTETKNY